MPHESERKGTKKRGRPRLEKHREVSSIRQIDDRIEELFCCYMSRIRIRQPLVPRAPPLTDSQCPLPPCLLSDESWTFYLLRSDDAVLSFFQSFCRDCRFSFATVIECAHFQWEMKITGLHRYLTVGSIDSPSPKQSFFFF